MHLTRSQCRKVEYGNLVRQDKNTLCLGVHEVQCELGNECLRQLIYTLDIGIFALTESINEKSISATAIPVDSRSETAQQEPMWSAKPMLCYIKMNTTTDF